MANSNHDHEHDGHVHDGHGHTHDGLPPHSHGEPTGNAIEKIGFTRSQFLRMCLAGVATGAAVPLGGGGRAGRDGWGERRLVLGGRGRAQVWQGELRNMLTCEWEKGAVLPSPLNAWHRHINTGKDPVRLVAITNAPLLIDMFRHTDFIFDNDYAFPERFDGRKDYFRATPQAFFPTVPRDRSGKTKERG